MMFDVPICENADILRVIYFIKLIINIVKIVIPIGLIVAIIIDCVKGITSENFKINNNVKMIVSRLIFAALIFFVPTIITVVMNAIDQKTEYESCWANANLETIKKYQVLQDKIEEENKQKEENIQNNNTNINNSNNDILIDDSNITFTYQYIKK